MVGRIHCLTQAVVELRLLKILIWIVCSISLSFFFLCEIVSVASCELLTANCSSIFAILKSRGFKHNFVYFSNIDHIEIVLLWVLWFLLVLIWFTFNLDFILLLLFFSFQLLPIIIVFAESEEILDGLPLSDRRWQICEAITQEDAVSSVMQDVLPYHLWQWLLFSFLLIYLLDIHQIFFPHIQRPEPALIQSLVSFWVVIDKVIYYALQL